MKKLVRILFVAAFASLPLFAIDEPTPPVDKPTDEVTLDEIKESQENTDEVSILDIKEEKEEEIVG